MSKNNKSNDNNTSESSFSVCRFIIFYILLPYIIFNIFDLKYYRIDSNKTDSGIYEIDPQSLKTGDNYFDVELIIEDKKKKWLYPISNTTLQYKQEQNLIIINACDESHRFNKIGKILGGCWTHNIIKLKKAQL